MALTDFGRVVRKARLDIDATLATMAEDLQVSVAFLSAMETGRKNISEDWIKKIDSYFLQRGVEIKNLAEYADISNETVSIAGLSPQKQMLVAGFARSNFDAETLEKLTKLIGEDTEY